MSAPPPERSITVDELLELRYLLLAGDFPRLDDRLAWNLDSARHDSGYELRYRAALGAFMSADPSLRPHLDAWVERAPRSVPAHLARAAYAARMAWTARGGKWRSETSDAQVRGMHEWNEFSSSDVARARALDSTNVLAHWIALDAAMRSSPIEVRRAIMEDGLRHVPGSMLLHWRFAYSLRPRWGGSAAHLLDFADEADQAAVLNPRLRLLRGLVAYDSAVVIAAADRDDEAIAVFSRALSYGDHWMYRVDRGSAYRALEQYELAIVDFDSALAQLPTLTEARAERGGALYGLSERTTGAAAAELVRRAKLDICIAAELDPTSRDVLWEIEQVPELRPASLGGTPPLSPMGDAGTTANPLLAGRC